MLAKGVIQGFLSGCSAAVYFVCIQSFNICKEFVDYPMLCYVDCFLVHCKFSRSQENLMRFDRHFGIPFYLKMFKRRIKLEKQLIAAIPYKKFLFYTVSRC